MYYAYINNINNTNPVFIAFNPWELHTERYKIITIIRKRKTYNVHMVKNGI